MMKNEPGNQVRDGLIELLPRLRRFALVLTGNSADADDLTQAGIERALTKAHLFRPDSRLDTWIYKIMQNLWIDEKRKTARRGPHVELDAAFETQGEDGRHTVETANMFGLVRKAIQKLPEDQRLVVGLVLVDGQSYSDAAEILDAPVGTVMSRLFRARKAIMAEVGDDHYGAGVIS